MSADIITACVLQSDCVDCLSIYEASRSPLVLGEGSRICQVNPTFTKDGQTEFELELSEGQAIDGTNGSHPSFVHHLFFFADVSFRLTIVDSPELTPFRPPPGNSRDEDACTDASDTDRLRFFDEEEGVSVCLPFSHVLWCKRNTAMVARASVTCVR